MTLNRWQKFVSALLLAMLFGLAAGAIRGMIADSGPGNAHVGQTADATLVLHRVTVAPGNQVAVPLILEIANNEVYSADITVNYDSAVATAVGVTRGHLVDDWSLASNLTTPGVARIALAGAQPVTGAGILLMITFQAEGTEGSATDLVLERGDLNEGEVTVALHDGRLTISSSPCYDFVDPLGVGVEDIQVIVGFWRQSVGRPYDCDGDGVITVADIMCAAAAWGPCR